MLCSSEQPTNVACGGACCNNSDCAGLAGAGILDCRFCSVDKKCSSSACGIACEDKSSCAGGDFNCKFCSLSKICTDSACDQPCSNPADCVGGNGGCKFCVGDTCGNKACGAICASSSDCAGSTDDCKVCENGICSGSTFKTSVIKFGLNFEDYNDGDYNDLSLCFEGKYSIDWKNKKIISIVDQPNQGIYIHNNSACYHKFVIYHENSKGILKEQRSLNDESNRSIYFNFAKGDTIRVTINYNYGCKSKFIGQYNNKTTFDKDRVKLEIDKCRM
ncbi:MAG: hypothetical protein LBE20_06515 [Deltaproteobacteria bacterium]|nr:hypothetical protein [Deltaproteobacteria bacterium]